jgi:hypothetical protein
VFDEFFRGGGGNDRGSGAVGVGKQAADEGGDPQGPVGWADEARDVDDAVAGPGEAEPDLQGGDDVPGGLASLWP